MGCNCGKGCEQSEVQAAKLKFLGEVNLFKRIPQNEHSTLASSAEQVLFSIGDTIITQGDKGGAFFVIQSGKAKVAVDGKEVATLGSSDFFGEMALLWDEPRTATITCAADIKALKITRDTFNKLGLRENLDFPKRSAVGDGKGKDVVRKDPSPKTNEDREMMTKAIMDNKNIATFVPMTPELANAMIDVMWKDTVETNTEIITEGDRSADYFYIVHEGSFEIQKGVARKSAEGADTLGFGNLMAGSSFGELALMYVAPRAATITAKQRSVVWVIDRTQFKDILSKAAKASSAGFIKHLDNVEMLNSLKNDEKVELANALNELSLDQDEVIFAQGEKGDRFYILIEGAVSVIKDGAEVAKLTATETSAQIFGEKALLNDAPRNATIKVTSKTAKTLYVDKQSFDMVLGPLQELQQRGKNGDAVVKKVAAAVSPNKQRRCGTIFRKDLRKLGLLGCGGFATVELVEHTKTGQIFALKAMSKGYILKAGMQNGVMNEKTVLMLCDSSFVIHLYETFNGDQSMYFLLEVALGGELYCIYNKINLYGREDCAQFYVAGVTYAFQHLHERKVIYRDLKPENLLLDNEGRIKITDMGLAKVSAAKTFTTCGTPDYFAPEMIASKGHTMAVDWWALGILTFELLTGRAPFSSPTQMQIYQKVRQGIGKVVFPKTINEKSGEFIKALCHNDPNERLPMKKGEIDNIKNAAWYQGFDWKAMWDKTMTPPHKPNIKHKKDKHNFKARAEDAPPQIHYVDPKTGWDKNFATSQ